MTTRLINTRDHVESLIESFPTIDADFKPDGHLTDNAVEMITGGVSPLLSDLEREDMAEIWLRDLVQRYMDELVKMGFTETFVDATGETRHRKVRDMSEADRDKAMETALRATES